jgi:phage/plasmid-like protein (TIGR03299 family)
MKASRPILIARRFSNTMAHEITIREDGKAEMAFAEGTDFPWHFDETQPAIVPKDATIPQWIIAAGLDWQVEPALVNYQVGDETFGMNDRYVLHRSDTKAPLGIVSGDYSIVQPGEVLGFFDSLVKGMGMKMETAGSLFGGRRFWALASVGELCLTRDVDPFKAYLLFSTSADGTRASEIRDTAIRVVCANTLRMSDSQDSEGQVKISHRTIFDAEDVKRRLGLAPVTFDAFMGKMRKLADHKVSDAEAREQVKIVLGKEKAEVNQEGKVFSRTMDLFRGLATGHDLPGVDGTAYGLLNAFTETLDHQSNAKSDSHRFANAMMGTGERTKAKFRDQLFTLVA